MNQCGWWGSVQLEGITAAHPTAYTLNPGLRCRSIATLQSNQLRGLVQRSLESYVSFFRTHEPVESIDPHQDTLLWDVPPVFVVELIVTDGKGHSQTLNWLQPSNGAAALHGPQMQVISVVELRYDTQVCRT
jgi:hypothetical protein